MGAGTFNHAEAISNTLSILSAFFRGKPCKQYTSELEIYLDADNTFRPDISVICDFSKRKNDGYYGAPALIVEVLSPSTVSYDRNEKFDTYEKYGVKEYLLINPEYLSVEQYALTDGKFKLQAIHFKRGTKFDSCAFEGLVFGLDEIFEYRRE
jgi:Uma2 family endonuclease